MKIWEFTCGQFEEFAGLVVTNLEDLDSGMFDVEGSPLAWTRRPQVSVNIERRKKKPKPRADISALCAGAIVVNARAYAAVGDILSRFGELLELDCEGAVEYFYNVTRVIDCIDLEHSDKRADESIEKEAFFVSKLPMGPALFKDPRTARGRIYANEPAKTILEALIQESGITGAAFVELGPPIRPRSAA